MKKIQLINVKSAGFTLVELLVVVTIIVTSGVLLLPRLNQFKDSQDLEQESERVLTGVKSAQASAISGAQCGDQFNPSLKSEYWQLTLNSTSFVIEPDCIGTDPALNIPIITTSLGTGAVVYRVNFDNGTRSSDPVDLSSAPNGQVGSKLRFSNVAGKIDFYDSSGLEVRNYNRMIIVLQMTGRSDKVGVFIEKGGLVYTGAVR